MKKIVFISLIAILQFSVLFAQKKENDKLAEGYYCQAKLIKKKNVKNCITEDQAKELLILMNKAISLNKKTIKYYNLRAYAQLQLDEYSLAIKDYKKVVRKDSKNTFALNGLAICYNKQMKYKSAVKKYYKAAKYSDKPSVEYFNLGNLYDDKSNYNEAIKAYSLSLSFNENFIDSYENRGFVYLKTKKYNRAIIDLDKAITLDSSNKSAMTNRGLCHFNLGNYNEALKDFYKAKDIDLGIAYTENYDTDKYLSNNIANTYFAMGNNEKACEYWNEAINLGYKYKKEWKEIYNIEDPVELYIKHCK